MLIGNLDARAEHDSTLPQFARFLRRGADGADEDAAQPALFQFVQTLDRCAAGAGDHVFEGGRMLAGFEHHFGASKDGLRREFGRHVARQTGRHPAIAQSLNHQVNVRRTAAAQAGDGVQQRFFQLKNQADGGENFFRQGGVTGGRRFSQRVRGCRGADQRRCIGHHANDARASVQRAFQPGDWNARRYRNEQMARRKGRTDFLQQRRDVGGFDGENQNAGKLNHVKIAVRRAGARFAGEGVSGGWRWIAGTNLGRLEQSRGDDAFGQRSGHLSAPEKTDGEFGSHAAFLTGRAAGRKHIIAESANERC